MDYLALLNVPPHPLPTGGPPGCTNSWAVVNRVRWSGQEIITWSIFGSHVMRVFLISIYIEWVIVKIGNVASFLLFLSSCCHLIFVMCICCNILFNLVCSGAQVVTVYIQSGCFNAFCYYVAYHCQWCESHAITNCVTCNIFKPIGWDFTLLLEIYVIYVKHVASICVTIMFLRLL